MRAAVRLLLEPGGGSLPGDAAALKDLLDFRCASITRSVKAAAGLARRRGLAVGLDCFSPALAGLVGQDLASLCLWGDWVKIMTYAHTLAPAGLPYELRGLLDWLCGPGEMQEQAALEWLVRSSGLALPESRLALAEKGLPPADLALEVRRARAMGVEQVLAGVELVELEGVTRLAADQAAADLHALHAAHPQGLALSWDLWRMPLEHLDWISNFYNLT